MKKVFTLIILFICLKLSALALPCTHTLKTPATGHDTLKLLAAVNPSDSGKTRQNQFRKDSLKQKGWTLKKDTATAEISPMKIDSTKQSALKNEVTIANQASTADSSKQVIPAQKTYTFASVDATSAFSIKQIDIVFKSDSVANLSSANRADSVFHFVLTSKQNEANAVAANQTDETKAASSDNVAVAATEPEIIDNNPPVTSALLLDSLRGEVIAEQNRQAEIKRQILRNEQVKLARVLKINDLDSLKEQLSLNNSDTVKALIYTRIALKYLNYDTIRNSKRQLYYQNQALNYTLMAIHQYAIFNDSTSLRMSFDNLTKVYYSQKKYSQAKWFILQSNTLSRAKNDIPNIISSLLTLANIKSDIKDYELAMRDLDEAMQLSVSTHSAKTQLEILKNYALLYNKLQNYPKEALVLKKRDSLLDSIRKSDEALLAKAAAQRKADSLQNKKKVFLASMRKLYKSNSSRKLASL